MAAQWGHPPQGEGTELRGVPVPLTEEAPLSSPPEIGYLTLLESLNPAHILVGERLVQTHTHKASQPAQLSESFMDHD